MLANLAATWNFPVINPWALSTDKLYHRDQHGVVTLAEGPTGFETLMPVLAERRRILWDESVVPHFHHGKPSLFPDLNKTIWMIRDPRDCLYSDWRRNTDGYDKFEDYLVGNWRGTGETPVAVLDDFHRTWLEAEATLDILRVRFEALKEDPLKTARLLAAHLNWMPTREQLDAATFAIDFDHARKTEQSLPFSLRARFPIHRAGRPQEWRQRWTKSQLALLPASFSALVMELGYPIRD